MTDLSLFFGSFHPVVVHLPIGAAFIALGLQLLSSVGRFRALEAAVPWLYGVAAAGAIGAVLSGWALGGAPGASWDAHRWFGVGTAVGLVLATALTLRRVNDRGTLRRATSGYASPVVGVVCAGLIGWTGHLGGAITHGEGHFAQYAPEVVRASLAGTGGAAVGSEADVLASVHRDSTAVYPALIAPLFEEHCVDCHRAGYAQGNLRLDSYAALAGGGSEGDARGLGGELWRRVTLPPEHPRFMPTRGTPLSFDELTVLSEWLGANADSAAVFAEVEWTDVGYAAIERAYGLDARERPYIDRARPVAIELPAELRYWRVSLISQEHTTYVAQLAPGADDVAAALAELGAFASNVVALDLRRLREADAFVAGLPELPHLTEVDLGDSDLTADGLARLERFEHLEKLRDWGTPAAGEVTAL